jgi:hypothetical protein
MESSSFWVQVVPAWVGAVTGLVGGVVGLLSFVYQIHVHKTTRKPGPNVDIQVMGYLKLPTSLTANIDVINFGDAPATLWNFHLYGSDAHVHPLEIQSLDGETASVVIPAHSRKHLALKGSPDASARDADAKVGSPPVLKVHTSYRREPIACPIPPRMAAFSDKLEADSARRLKERET